MGAILLGTLLLLPSCKSDDHCLANADCPMSEACVHDKCISDVKDCDNLGGLIELDLGTGLLADTIDEIHMTIDQGGALHACYSGENGLSGQSGSYYTVQTGSDSFNHEPLDDNGQIRCGAIAVASDGTPYIFSKSTSAVLQPSASGGWGTIPLTGLEGIEAQGAISGDRTLITMTPDSAGGVYLAMSLGFQLEHQPIYLAHIVGGQLEVIVNGWSESGEHTNIGHAPMWVPGVEGQGSLLHGNVLGFTVNLSDEQMTPQAQAEGLYPKAHMGPSGQTMVTYMDRNYQLIVDQVDGGNFENLAVVGRVGIDESSDGQVPWTISTDPAGNAHLLYEDKDQSQGAVMYRRVLSDGTVEEPEYITDNLPTNLPGMQRYAINTDICGRPTMAVVENESTDGTGGVVLKMVEGR